MTTWTSFLAGSPLEGLGLLGYLDPGTGSYALQMLFAGLFGGMFALKQSWAGVKGWISARGVRPIGGQGQPEHAPETSRP